MSSKDASISVQNKKLESSPNSQGFQVITISMVLFDDWLGLRLKWKMDSRHRDQSCKRTSGQSCASPQHERFSSHLNARFGQQQP